MLSKITYIYIYIDYRLYTHTLSWIQITPGVTLNYVTPLNIFLLDENFDESIVGLDFLLLYMLAKLQDDLRSITILLIKCLNFNFLYLKLCIKYGFLDRKVIGIQLA